MISIYDWFGYDVPIKKRYQFIKEAGFDGVMLWWSDGFGRDCFGQSDYRNGPNFAREAGLLIENIHAPVHNQNNLWIDNLDGEALMDCYLQCIHDCAEFEIPTMVLHLPHDENCCHSLGLKRIMKIAEEAEHLDVNVALENLQNLNNVSYVLERIDSPNLGFCYDCGHHYRYNPDQDLLACYGLRLMALHLHDNGGAYYQHQLPFDGTIDWLSVMQNIAETGYEGSTAIEAMNWDYKELSMKEFLNKAYEKAIMLEKLRCCDNKEVMN